MVIINPDSPTHEISIIPRYYVNDTFTYLIIDEDTKEAQTIVLNSNILANGFMVVNFDLTVTNNKSYSLKITSDTTSDVVFRGKMFATNQVTQNYQING